MRTNDDTQQLIADYHLVMAMVQNLDNIPRGGAEEILAAFHVRASGEGRAANTVHPSVVGEVLEMLPHSVHPVYRSGGSGPALDLLHQRMREQLKGERHVAH